MLSQLFGNYFSSSRRCVVRLFNYPFDSKIFQLIDSLPNLIEYFCRLVLESNIEYRSFEGSYQIYITACTIVTAGHKSTFAVHCEDINSALAIQDVRFELHFGPIKSTALAKNKIQNSCVGSILKANYNIIRNI